MWPPICPGSPGQPADNPQSFMIFSIFRFHEEYNNKINYKLMDRKEKIKKRKRSRKLIENEKKGKE